MVPAATSGIGLSLSLQHSSAIPILAASSNTIDTTHHNNNNHNHHHSLHSFTRTNNNNNNDNDDDAPEKMAGSFVESRNSILNNTEVHRRVITGEIKEEDTTDVSPRVLTDVDSEADSDE